MSRFLIDENMFPAVAEFLREKGHDAVDVYSENLQGSEDDLIFAHAQQEKRIIVTFDKHFADVLRYPPSRHCGVIRIRIEPPILEHILAALQNLLNQLDETEYFGTLAVLDQNGFRIRRKP